MHDSACIHVLTSHHDLPISTLPYRNAALLRRAAAACRPRAVLRAAVGVSTPLVVPSQQIPELLIVYFQELSFDCESCAFRRPCDCVKQLPAHVCNSVDDRCALRDSCDSVKQLPTWRVPHGSCAVRRSCPCVTHQLVQAGKPNQDTAP